MKKATQEDYINYRLERAWKTFEDAKYLASVKSWDSSVNRLYYACFYSVLALFSKYQIPGHKPQSKLWTHASAASYGELNHTLALLMDTVPGTDNSSVPGSEEPE